MGKEKGVALEAHIQGDSNLTSLYAGLREGVSPLWQMICRKRQRQHSDSQLRTIERLLKRGCDVNEAWDYRELWQRYSQDVFDEPFLEGLVYGCVEDFDSRMVSPLLSAISTDDIEVVRLLLPHGADVHGSSRLGTTALHEAVRTGSKDMAGLLLDHGADIKAQAKTGHYLGCTPLHLAVINADDAMVEYIAGKGANVQVTTPVGWRAIDIAIIDRQVALVNLLLRLSDVSHWSERPSPRMTEQCSETDSPSALAQHVLRHGIRNSEKSHYRVYSECLSSVIAQLGPATIGSAEAGERLVFEVERSLLQLAGVECEVAWSRKFCAACENFQRRDYSDLRRVFKHSNSLDITQISAKQGCHLCQALIKAHEQRSGWEGKEHLCASDEVLLQVDDSYGWEKVFMGCSGRTSMLKLGFVNEEVHTAICSTESSDKQGTASQRTLSIAKSWMQHCIKSHQDCHSTGEMILPTRVINVGDDRRQPFLIETSGTQARYVALSYCRGDQSILCTLRSNYQQHLEGIHLNHMSKSVRDAVEITRNLEISYLWVDSLCMIQDSDEDLEEHVARMGSIFSNATVTIAVQDSPNCSQGIFRPREWISSAAIPLDLRLPARFHHTGGSSQINRVMTLPLPRRHRTDSDLSVLGEWGSTLQEEVLSRRILRCWNEEISWDCLQSHCSETSPTEGLPSPQRLGQLKWAIFTGKDYWTKEQIDRQKMFQRWCEAVTMYSHRPHSQPKDKIVALIGLQSRVANFLNDTPLLGCWMQDHFWPSCLWACSNAPGPTAAGDSGIICPSWSWASVTLPVHYNLISNEPNAVFSPKVTSWNLRTIKHNVHVLGSITVSCKLMRARDVQIVTDPRERDKKAECDLSEWLEGKIPGKLPLNAIPLLLSRPRIECFVFSMHKDPRFPIPAEDIWYLHVADRPFQPPPETPRGVACVYPVWPQGRAPSVLMMCLEKISSDEMHFRRIGLAEAWDKPPWREKAMQCSIELF